MEYASFYKNQLEITPCDLYSMQFPKLLQLFDDPSKEQVMLLGSVIHDAGFGSRVRRPIVNVDLSLSKIIQLAIYDRKKLSSIYRRQYWKQGFLKTYGLTIFRKINIIRNIINKIFSY